MKSQPGKSLSLWYGTERMGRILSSAGLRALMIGQKTANANGKTMILRNVGELVMEVFEITGFAELLTVKNNLEHYDLKIKMADVKIIYCESSYYTDNIDSSMPLILMLLVNAEYQRGQGMDFIYGFVCRNRCIHEIKIFTGRGGL